MKRVVITGMGIWSCIGQDLQTVTENLRTGYSGIVFDPKRIEQGLHCGLKGNVPRPNLKPLLPRKFRTTMSDDAEYAYMAALQAFNQSGINNNYLLNHEIGIIFGNDGNSAQCEIIQSINQSRDSFALGPSALFRSETSSVTMNLSTIFHLKGINCSIGAACASSSHAIGIASMFIREGLQNIILAGGSCEVEGGAAAAADAIEALSLRNTEPQKASRPFDKNRDGMVPSGGAAALVLEEYEHAIARGATILAELAGYGFSSNGLEDISQPSHEAERKAMQRALNSANLTPTNIDYVNAHATSTLMGDQQEAIALTNLFKNSHTWIGATKSMTGHENWMAGASEAIYTILMMQNNFIAPTINLDHLDDCAKHLRIATSCTPCNIQIALSNSSGMGGTNSALIFKKLS